MVIIEAPIVPRRAESARSVPYGAPMAPPCGSSMCKASCSQGSLVRALMVAKQVTFAGAWL